MGEIQSPSSRRVAFESARLKLARVQLQGASALDTAFRLVTQSVCDAVQVERAGIWFFENVGARLVCKEMFLLSRREHTSGAELHSETFPHYLQALAERRAIVADDARSHEDTRELAHEYLEPNGITSMLDAPIIRRGQVVGVVCQEHVGPLRRWQPAEIDFAGSVGDLVALILEQAERAELEAALKLELERRLEAQKLEALAHLARAVAHDFNNVLGMCLAIATGHAKAGLGPSCERAGQEVRDAVEIGARLVAKLLDVGRRQASEQSVDPADVIEGLMTALRALTGPQIDVTARIRDTGAVRVSRADLERILINLVANSRDAVGESGHVEIVLRASEPDDDAAGALILEVSDDGRGMDAETRAHLFEPYFTTKEEGHGLGLATVYGIVQRAGGSVAAASERDTGTTIRVVLPLS